MKTVLYYEDDPFLAAMYQAKLQMAGFNVVHQEHPTDPVDTAKALHPDLILMDTLMPEMDGFTATTLLKADPATRPISVFGLSNLNQTADRAHALAVGMVDHWVSADHKPDEVVEKIRSLIDSSDSERDTARNTYANPLDGNTYYLAPFSDGGDEVLWACPTNADGSADFESAIPETDFVPPLKPKEREGIVRALTKAKVSVLKTFWPLFVLLLLGVFVFLLSTIRE